MRDELYDRDYQAARAELHAGFDRFLHRLGTAVMVAFDTLHRIEWSAPWKKDDRAGLA